MIEKIKIAICLIGILIIAIFITPICLLRPFHLNNARLFSSLYSPFALWVMGIRLEKRNLSKIPSAHPGIIIANHQHTIDLWTMSPNNFSEKIAYIGKKSLVFIPFVGWIFYLSGEFLIDRKNRKKAIDTLHKAKEFLEHKRASIFIMPEGTRSWKEGMGKFKKGAFHMAMELKRPIIPLVYSSYHRTLKLNSFKMSQIIVQALEPISTEGWTKDKLDQIILDIRQKMIQVQEELDQEILAKA